MDTRTFYWWCGVVEDRNDPERKGRFRVRVLGYHNEKRLEGEQPVIDLPWATCMMPVTSASISGIGEAPNIIEGTWVFGFWHDGRSTQVPIILGSLPGVPNFDDWEDIGAKTPYGFTDSVPEDEPDFDGQQTRKDQPRLLTSRTLNLDGTGSTFTEENGSSDLRQPDADGFRKYNDRDGYLYRQRAFSLLQQNEDADGRSRTTAAFEFENDNQSDLVSPSDEFYDSEWIVNHKIDTLDLVVPTGCPLDGLDEIEFAQPDTLTCTDGGGNTGEYDGIEAEDAAAGEGEFAGTLDIDQPSNKPAQEITSKLSPDEYLESNELKAWDEPSTQAYPTYPFNQVKQTEAGHVVEFDNTPGQERIHEFHRTGTFREIHPDGTKVEKIVNDNYTIILKDDHMHVEGNVFITIDKGAKLFVNRDGSDAEDGAGEANNFDILIGKGGNINIDVEEGDVVTRIRKGDSITTLEEGDQYTNLTDGDSIISVEKGKVELVAKEVSIETSEDLSIYVKGEAKIKVDKDCCIDVGGDLKAKVKGDAVLDVRKNLLAYINEEAHIHSVEQMTLTSDKRILMVAPVIDLNP